MSQKTPITITGIFHPLGWGCGFACDSDPSIYNPIIPKDGCCHCSDGSDDGDSMKYHGIVNSLSEISFIPKNGDIVQVLDGSGNLIEYIYTDNGWDPIGETPLVQGKGININNNTISVKVKDNNSLVVDNDGIGLTWNVYQ